MSPAEIVAMIKKDSPVVLGNVSEEAAAKIVRKAMALVASRIAALEEGELQVAGLGRFKVRKVERVKEGQTTTVRRVIYAKAQAGEGKKAAKPAKPAA